MRGDFLSILRRQLDDGYRRVAALRQLGCDRTDEGIAAARTCEEM
jgi:hypothetical protein